MRVQAERGSLKIPYKAGTPEYQREWRKLNRDKQKGYDFKRRDKSREYNWMKRYGITAEKYYSRLKDQGGKCAICKTEEPGRGEYLHVDHCHDNGFIRGLLCDTCNRGLGYFKDNIEALERARTYLLNFYKQYKDLP